MTITEEKKERAKKYSPFCTLLAVLFEFISIFFVGRWITMPEEKKVRSTEYILFIFEFISNFFEAR